jgi:SAM-dependent methyltransferase
MPVIDTPETSVEHGKLIQSKGLLRRWYLENYKWFQSRLNGGTVLELGSGGGFLKEVIPSVITSDIMPIPGCDRRLSAENLPFPTNSVSAILLIDVLHHVKDVEAFFREAERTLVSSGKILAIEPASTWWARFIWKNFHHEPYDEYANWEIPDSGPLSGANIALPWIIFERDRKIFENRFPLLKISRIETYTPFLYLLSGGVRNWSLLPSFMFTPLRFIESLLDRSMGMFLRIELVRV